MECKKIISYSLVIIFVCSCLTTVGIMGIEPFPTISNIHHTPINPKSTDYVTVLADISHNESLSYVTVHYLGEGEEEWTSVNMKNYFGSTWYAHIPPKDDNSTVIYKIVATTISGYTDTSMNYTYTVRDHNVPTIYSVRREPLSPKYDELVNVTANIYDLSGIQSVLLKYKFDSNDTTQVPMTYDANSTCYNATIPNTDVIGAKVQYWVEATNNLSISETSRTYYYYTVGDAPYLADMWTEPYNATEGTPLTFYVDLFQRCDISDGNIYTKIQSSGHKTLNYPNGNLPDDWDYTFIAEHESSTDSIDDWQVYNNDEITSIYDDCNYIVLKNDSYVYENGHFSFNVYPSDDDTLGIIFRYWENSGVPTFYLLTNVKNRKHEVTDHFSGDNQTKDKLELFYIEGLAATKIESESWSRTDTQTYEFDIYCDDDQITVNIDGEQELSVSDSSILREGYIGFLAGSCTGLTFSNIAMDTSQILRLTLPLTQIDETKWASEPIDGSELSGGDTLEYWCQCNYSSNGENYYLYPSNPTHYYKTVVEYNPPEIDGISILPSIIKKGDEVELNATVTDQSLTEVKCIWAIPGIINDTNQPMSKIQGTNIYTTTLDTADLPENKSVVITIKATDSYGNKETKLYSGFFINDGSPPVLYGIVDLQDEPICYSYEHTLYVYVNDTSEIDWVKLHLWTNNDSQDYGCFYMVKGGEYLFYYSLDNSPFDISPTTWISYRFEAQDIYGHYANSSIYKFYVDDYLEPKFEEFYIDADIGYKENPIIKAKVSDGELGVGVQAVSLIYSDDNWITNYTLQMNNQGGGWWKAITVPPLFVNLTRRYYFTSIDYNNNPSQSFTSNYSTIDFYNPHIITSKINDGEPIYDNYTLASEVHWEVWLEDPNGINSNNVNLTFYSSFDNEAYTYSMTYVSAQEKFETTITDYDWIGDDWITYHYETEDLLENRGNTTTNGFSVIDTEEPTISAFISSSGTAWLNSENTEHDSGCTYYNADVWKLKLQGAWDVAVWIGDAGIITEARLYYTIEGGTWENYIVLTYDDGIDKYKGTITSSTLISLYESYYSAYYFPHLEHEIVFVKVWAIDNASQVGEYDYWNQDSECYEMFDYDSPEIDVYNIPSEKDHGTDITIAIDASDLKGIQPDAFDGVQIRFRNDGNTYGYYTMEKIAGDRYDGTWRYIWSIPTSVYGTVNVDFKLKDYDGDNNWDCVFDTTPQTTTDETQTFYARDATAPTIIDWGNVPSPITYLTIVYFWVTATDSHSGIDEVWLEWILDDVSQTDLSMSYYSGNEYRTSNQGPFDWGTDIDYRVKVIDEDGNTAYGNWEMTQCYDNVQPTPSSIYHTPNPFDEDDSYVYVYTTWTDDVENGGAGISWAKVKYWKDDVYQGYVTAVHQGSNVYKATIDVSAWAWDAELKYQPFALDNASNTKYASIYGPYTIQDATPPSIYNVHEHPSTVYLLDDVIVHATVIDGNGLDWVRCYYKVGAGGTWYYKTMQELSGNEYEAIDLPNTPAYATVYYYVKAKDNNNEYKTSITKSYYIDFDFVPQPSLNHIDIADLTPDYDEGLLKFDKDIQTLIPKNLIQYIILEYKSMGEPSWHRVVLQEENDYYSAYICSAKSLILEFKLITYVGEIKKSYSSGIQEVELVDLTPPAIEIQYTPEIPEYGEAIHFSIEVFDASGISKVTCSYTTTGEQWKIEVIKQENNRFRYYFILVESIRFVFEATDNNGYSASSNLIEFLVLPHITNPLGDTSTNNYWTILFSILGGLTILSVSGYIFLRPRFKLNFRRMVK